MAGSYSSLMKLWDDINCGAEDHPCVSEPFDTCQVCERAVEARSQLGYRLMDVMRLLQKYHDVLKDLVDNVIQEVPLPREERLQLVMLKAVSILDQDGRSHGQD